jgi:hypothetical protein
MNTGFGATNRLTAIPRSGEEHSTLDTERSRASFLHLLILKNDAKNW